MSNQRLADKFGLSVDLLNATKSVLSESGSYQQKVKAHMAKKGIKSLSDMTADQKKNFFNELDAMHKAKNEEVEPVEEAESHQTKTTMKHISKPTAGEKKAAKDIKPGVAGYRDRVAMLKSAEARGALKKEEVELTQEDLDFIASLNASDETVSEDLNDLDSFVLEDIQAFMQTEDFEQLDELGKETLGNYIKKRSHDVATQGAITRQHAVDSRAEKEKQGGYMTRSVRDLDAKADKAFTKGWKHRQNIAKAVDKLVKKS